MNRRLCAKDAFGYFRMGLVTGIVEKQALVEWADNEIDRNPVPEHEIVELSLSGNLPHSQIIRLLNSFEGQADYDLSLGLLTEEEYFPEDVTRRLADLRKSLDLYEQTIISFDDLSGQLSRFLEENSDYRPLLDQTA